MQDKPDTLPKLLKRNYEKYGERKLSMAVKDYGIWQPYTWREYYTNVKHFCLGLVDLGLQRGDKVSVLGETKPEAYWAELAVQVLRGAVVGIFTDCLPNEVEYFVKHSDSRFIVAHDQEQVDKVLQIMSNLPLLKRIIYWDPKGLWSYGDEILISFHDVLELGKKSEESHQGLFEAMINNGEEEDIAAICYTSGTTGDPKGVMISHKCLIGNARIWCQELYQWRDKDDYVSFLPLAWITEQMMLASTLVSGIVVNFIEKPETVQQDIRETGPQILFWGARNWESVNRLIQAKIADTTIVNRLLYNLLLPVGYKIADIKTKGKEEGFLWKVLYWIADCLLFKPLRDRVGLLRVKHAFTGGAPTSPDVIRYFQAIGIRIHVAYGASEFPLICLERNLGINTGTSGPPLPGVEVKISEDGEIIARGRYMFSGYYKNREATAEKVREGWYYTGDFGHITEGGELVVMDRLNDVRTLKNGKKYSPQYIESRLRFSPYIKDLLIVGGEEHDFVCSLVNIDMDNVGRWAERKRIPYTSYADLSQKLEVIGLVKEEFKRVNNLIPEEARVRRFINMHKEFDADDAELTRTRKIKRDFMEERYRDMIASIYRDVKEMDVEAPVTYRDGRKGTIKTNVKINSMN
jgi:long-chain acyl-CoA synthetase